MSSGVFFSIIIPVYNVDGYLVECLESVLNQTYKNFEIVLTNDGSTDSSGDICDKYKNKYPSKIILNHNKNIGLFKTREFGIKQSNGDYIIHIDSDDMLRKDALELLSNVIVKEQPDLILYSMSRDIEFKTKYLSNNLELNTIVPLSHIHIEVIERKLNNLFLKCISRNLINCEKDYPNTNLSIGEDLVQTLPLINRAKKIYNLDQILYFYRENPNSMMNTIKPNVIDDYIVMLDTCLKYSEKWGVDEKLKLTANTEQIVVLIYLIIKIKISMKEKLILIRGIVNHSISNDLFKYKPRNLKRCLIFYFLQFLKFIKFI